MSRDEKLLIELTKAEKRALRILAALGEISMGEYVRREAIHELWSQHYPDAPLGQEPSVKKKNNDGDR
jgi:hypothetical protein